MIIKGISSTKAIDFMRYCVQIKYQDLTLNLKAIQKI